MPLQVCVFPQLIEMDHKYNQLLNQLNTIPTEL